MPRVIPGRVTPPGRRVDIALPTIEKFPEADITSLEGLISQDDFVKLEVRDLITEFKDEETKDSRKKEIIKTILGDLYFLSKNPRNNFSKEDRGVLDRLLPLVEAQAQKLGINIQAEKEAADQEISEIGAELAKKNVLTITDKKLKKRLGSEQVIVEEVTDSHVVLANDQFQTFRLAKTDLDGKYQLESYGQVEKQGPAGEWPVPEAGGRMSIVVEGKEVGTISSTDGQRMLIATIDGRQIITSKKRATTRMERLFKPKPKE